MNQDYIDRNIYSELSKSKSINPGFIFLQLSKSKAGYIHKKDLKNALVLRNNRSIENFFIDIDKDQDSKISWKEWNQYFYKDKNQIRNAQNEIRTNREIKSKLGNIVNIEIDSTKKNQKKSNTSGREEEYYVTSKSPPKYVSITKRSIEKSFTKSTKISPDNNLDLLERKLRYIKVSPDSKVQTEGTSKRESFESNSEKMENFSNLLKSDHKNVLKKSNEISSSKLYSSRNSSREKLGDYKIDSLKISKYNISMNKITQRNTNHNVMQARDYIIEKVRSQRKTLKSDKLVKSIPNPELQVSGFLNARLGIRNEYYIKEQKDLLGSIERKLNMA